MACDGDRKRPGAWLVNSAHADMSAIEFQQDVNP